MLNIIKCGAATPAGQTCPVSVASARAGIVRLKQHHEFKDSGLEPVIVGMAQYINEYIGLKDRFIQLSGPALEESISDLLTLSIGSKPVPLIVALPEARSGLPSDLPAGLAETFMKIGAQQGLTFKMEFLSDGHAAGLSAFKTADHLVREEDYPFAVVGGVDSYFDRDTISWLEENRRLFCSHHKDGFIPGEAAAFCLLASDVSLEKFKFSSLAKVIGIETAEEPRPHGAELTTLGEGLTNAVKEVLKDLPEEKKVNQMYYELSGESYRALECGYMLNRLGQRFEDIGNMVNRSKSWGDLGAASAIISICMATEAARKKYTKGPLNLILAGSLGKPRSVALLEV